jgi:triphosphatase
MTSKGRYRVTSVTLKHRHHLGIMQKETEIKLRVSRETLAALRDHPLLKKRNKSGWQRHELFNQYYDTPERELAQAKVALRLRCDGEQFIQTLKSRGQSVAGLSERNEWDWYLDKAKLDLKKLADDCWPASLAELDKKTLKPIFTTDFVREKAEIAWGRGKSKVVIEAALDLGKVVVGKQSEEICELELELRQGEPEALLELAAELAADLALMPCDISKAERGYRLHDADSYSLSLPAPQLEATMPLDDAFAALAWQLLGNSQRLAEQYRFNGRWKLIGDWLQQLVEFRALLGSLGQAAPRMTSRELREQLDALIHDWRPRIEAGRDDESVRQAAPAQFALELAEPRWGLFSLKASLWLLQRGWTAERNNRGNRQGAAELGNWLPRHLGEEAAALQLQRYQQQPEDLAEQRPRMERLLVWLHLARTALELPEADRLYGELAKLYELAAQPLDDELLDARIEQARIVSTVKAWKLLTK